MNQNSGNSTLLESGSTSQASKAFKASIASKASSPFMPQDNLQHSDPLPSKKVLIITYYWPPSAGAGVQRWLKFAKYLPSSGWEPLIITVDPEYATYPALDHSLDRDLDSKIRIWKTRATDYFRIYRRDKSKVPAAGFASSDEKSFKGWLIRFVRGNFFIPDPRRGWNKYAFKQASELILSEGVTHVITTSPPHSTQLIGIKLKKKFPSIKWIADLRDPWTDIYYYSLFNHTPPAKALDSHYERKTLELADSLITVGDSLRDLFLSKYKDAANKIHTITNGFDETDFQAKSNGFNTEFVVTYTGTLSESYPMKSFIEAAVNYIAGGNRLKIRFIGTVSPAWREKMETSGLSDVLEFVPYVEHIKAIRYMLDSSANLLIIPDHSSNRSIITGKLFEYIASRRPIICIGPPDGDAAAIINESESGRVHEYNDVAGIEKTLEELGKGNLRINEAGINKYSRRELTSKLAGLLSRL